MDEGRYLGSPSRCFLAKAQNEKQTQYMAIEIVIHTRLFHDGSTSDVQGRPSKTVRIWLTHKAKDRSKNQFEAAGFNWNFDEPFFENQDTPVVCKHEEYKGKAQERWEIADERAEDQPLVDEEISKLKDMFGVQPKAAVASDGARADVPF